MFYTTSTGMIFTALRVLLIGAIIRMTLAFIDVAYSGMIDTYIGMLDTNRDTTLMGKCQVQAVD